MELQVLRDKFPILQIYKNRLVPDEYKILEYWLCTFFDFQLEWILDPSPLAAINKSRQIGISHSTSAQVILYAVYHGETCTVISLGQLESSEFLEKCKAHTRVLKRLGSKLVKTDRDVSNLLSFEAGGRIFALPSSGGRSFSGTVIIDEMAYLENADDTWDAAMGGTIHQGRKARIISTPNGVGNTFHNLITNPLANKGWSIHQVPISRALADGMVVDIEKCWSLAHGDPRLYSQMFECAFLDGDEQYIPTDFIRKAQCIEHRCPSGVSGFNYAGLDLGSTSDPTVLWILKKSADGMRYTQYVERVNPTTDADIDRLVSFAVDDMQCKKVCIDKTGLGEMPAKRQVERYKRIVEPIDFKEKSKETLATGMYVILAQNQLLLPADKSILTQFSSIKRIQTKAGHVKYDSPRGKFGHADDFWACALAAHGCSGANRLAGVSTGKLNKYGRSGRRV